MRYIEHEIKELKDAYIIPIGDVHVGDKNFLKEGLPLLKGTLRKARELNARIFLNGDIFNVGSRISKTSPFENDTDEYTLASEIFADYKDLIIGATDGNHEGRMMDMFGFSPTQMLCKDLGVPYCGWSAAVRIRMGKRATITRGYRENYLLYFHHTTGGGGTIGSKLNRVVKLRDILEGADVYVGSHNHQLVTAPQQVYVSTPQGGLMQRQIWYVDSGSYVSWDNSYAEKGMLPPATLGSPIIKLSAYTHKVEVRL